ncbi:LuxR C-terminal-related transcriptional regulator [Salipiger sp. P9]|uniref:helix-turn-helix transcriptional regulator n=1 Tax=Salipiger pentaromativorans TaxID=2943193 RepID=UPI00215737A8|nr:LuxR C-terminal-related transcriptional regulator [Salipiger pentaromativorans]MCR8550611.1 LuxR C-terminal-related transcriptional regulator [Salipiger pentaromativorans]
MIYTRIDLAGAEAINPLGGMAGLVEAVGSDAFCPRVETLLMERFGISELLVVQSALSEGRPDILQSHSRDARSHERARAYGSQFFADDPIFSVLTPDAPDGVYSLRVRAEDIRNPRYRSACYTRPGLSEKLTLARKDEGRVLLLSLFTAAGEPGFDAERVAALCDLGSLLLPLISLHFRLVGEDKRCTRVSAEAMEERVGRAFPELTGREIAVCARSILGVTAEGIALDLGIKQTSVLTYRRRAYARLNVNSINQLSTMLIQSPAAHKLAAAS